MTEVIKGDIRCFEKVMLCLLENAVRFCTQGNRVVIDIIYEARPSMSKIFNGKMSVSVRDYGMGMDPAQK